MEDAQGGECVEESEEECKEKVDAGNYEVVTDSLNEGTVGVEIPLLDLTGGQENRSTLINEQEKDENLN